MAEPDQPPAPLSIKLAVVGDGMVGKTCLCHTFKHGAFPKDDKHVPTIFENSTLDMTLNGLRVQLNVWDTAGQEAFEGLRPLMYPGTDVFLLCYAVNNVSSFENVTAKWAPELRQHCPRARLVLVGTKSDCRRDAAERSAVDKARAKRLASGRLKADGFVECSARNNDGVREAFEAAVWAVLGRPQQRPGPSCCAVL